MKKIIKHKSYSSKLCDFTLFTEKSIYHDGTSSEEKLIRISFSSDINDKDIAYFRKYHSNAAIEKQIGFSYHAYCASQIFEYLDGKRVQFNIEYVIYATAFQQEVLNSIIELPYNSVTFIGDLRPDVQDASKATLSNPLPIIIPCHRVNARENEITAYVGGVPLKRKLQALERESATGGGAIKSATESSFDFSLLTDKVNTRDEFLDIRIDCESRNIPCTKPLATAFIRQICEIKKPCNLLEIGTAEGYCSCNLSKFVSNKIYTIERDADRCIKARENFQKHSINNVVLLEGDALEVIEGIDEKFDIVYIDAAKGQNSRFFELIKSKINDDAVIIVDNVAYKGQINFGEKPQRKSRTMTRNMQDFVDFVLENDEFTSNIVPIDDGLLIINPKY